MTNDGQQTPEAENTARRAIEVDPHSSIAYYNLGSLLARDNLRASEAESAYRQAIELEPNNARYIYRLSLLLHEKLDRLEEADSLYRRAIELVPDDPFYYGGLISLLVQQSRRSEALEFSIKMRALLIAKENWYGLATLDAILGNVESALENLRQAALKEAFDRQWAQIDPDLASIRHDERFLEIVGSL